MAFLVLVESLDYSGDAIDKVRDIDANKAAYITGAVLQSLAFVAVAPVLVYLYRVTAYRRPETPSWSPTVAVVGALVLGASTLGTSIANLGAVDDVLADLPLSVVDAEDRLREGQEQGAGLLFLVFGYASRIALAFALISISNAARRAGTLSNFLGITGIIVGVFLVLPFFGPLPIVQWFWLAAVGVLFIGRWPTARGPAWESGEAEPWPSAAELRAQAAAERGDAIDEHDYEDEEYEDDEYEDEPEPERGDPSAPARPQHPKSKKRKRKRRR